MSWCQGAKEPMSQGGLIMYLNENVFSVLVSLFAFSTCFLYLNENVLANQRMCTIIIQCGPIRGDVTSTSLLSLPAFCT